MSAGDWTDERLRRFQDFLDDVTNSCYMVEKILESKRGLKHERHQEHLAPAIAIVRTVMQKYFARQQDAILIAILPHLRSHVEQFNEARRTNGHALSKSILPNSVAPLRFAVLSSEDEAYSAAITSAFQGAGSVIRAEMISDAAAHPNFASNYLRNNSLSKLTGNIAETTKDRLRNAIASEWDKGGTFEGLVSAIKSTFAGFSDVRASMIAQTEVVRAYSVGREATARAAGFNEKSWETESGNPCEICLGNEAQEWIGIDEDFASGDSGPTAHVNCECILNFRSGTG